MAIFKLTLMRIIPIYTTITATFFLCAHDRKLINPQIQIIYILHNKKGVKNAFFVCNDLQKGGAPINAIQTK